MKRIVLGMMIVAVMNHLGSCPVQAEESTVNSGEQNVKLYQGIKAAKVSLRGGLSASESKGKPISAKFEMEDGKLQLSVYTMNGRQLSEIVVDHETGKIAKVETITGGDDLAAAKTQSEAMAQAKSSLRAALGEVLLTNKGYRGVSILPSLKDGHPVADVTLTNGKDQKVVSGKLD